MNIQKKATCPTANEFVSIFLSQNFEKSPWVLNHIDSRRNLSDSFDIDTSRLKSAVDYINEYNTSSDCLVFNFEQANASKTSKNENLPLSNFPINYKFWILDCLGSRKNR